MSLFRPSLVLMVLFVYASVFVVRNWPLSRQVLPYGVGLAVVATAFALPTAMMNMPVIFTSAA